MSIERISVHRPAHFELATGTPMLCISLRGSHLIVPFAGEPDPELVFQAANRIGDLDHDLAALPEPYRIIRHGLASMGGCSMSSGDWCQVVSGDGFILGTWTCESVGWTITDADGRIVSSPRR